MREFLARKGSYNNFVLINENIRGQETERFHKSTEGYCVLSSFNGVEAIGFGDTTMERLLTTNVR